MPESRATFQGEFILPVPYPPRRFPGRSLSWKAPYGISHGRIKHFFDGCSWSELQPDLLDHSRSVQVR